MFFIQMRIKIVFILLMVTIFSNSSIPAEPGRTRKPAVAGRFYPADSNELRSDVRAFLAEAGSQGTTRVQAVIVPHAGYVFSGATAAKAFAQIAPESSFRRIFLLGPSHQAAFDGASINTVCDSYQTPLGKIAVDRSVCEKLLQTDRVFGYVAEAHRQEHCLEVELPFLQERLKEMPPIVPIIIGTQKLEKLQRIANALRPYFTAENLFVISSDFSHYPSYEDALEVDKTTGDAIQSVSLERFLQVIADGSSQGIPNLYTMACGQAPIAVLLMLVQNNRGLEMKHLFYCNSGDSPYGGRDEVVGYHAFALFRTSEAYPSDSFSLTDEDKAVLLRIARRSILDKWTKDGFPSYASEEVSDMLRMKCGAFVTLHSHGQLRGCIGTLVGNRPLFEVVSEMAQAAAFEDPRFYPVEEAEMKEIQIEISVLSPLRRIHSIDEFELGRHGIFMVKGGHRGTFLPQVAEETHWSKEEFLGHCARDKAGIGWNGWHDAELYVYEAEVFHERAYE